MFRNIARYSKPGLHPIRKLTLAVAAAALVGAANIAPAKAWYDAYGYWHPERHRYYLRDNDRSAYAERNHWWCERHPASCGYGHRYTYEYPYHRYSYNYYYDYDYYRR
jgi:hypothetical protein